MDPHSTLMVDPDPHSLKILNPDPHSLKRLDPYQHKIDADAKHCMWLISFLFIEIYWRKG
jgi:hypothetical protein